MDQPLKDWALAEVAFKNTLGIGEGFGRVDVLPVAVANELCGMSAESPRTIAVAKIAQQIAMRTLDFMFLALLDTAWHQHRPSIGSSKHQVGQRKHKQYPEHIRPE